jgi:ribosomal protein L34E
MAQRVTLRKRNPYNTTSAKRRMVKTPGGRLVYHHLKKNATAPKCGDCGIALPGVSLCYLLPLPERRSSCAGHPPSYPPYCSSAPFILSS